MLEKDIEKKSLLEALGLQNAPVEKQEEVVAMALRLVEMKVFEAILAKLEEEKAREFLTLLEQKKEKPLALFFQKEDIDIVLLIENEVVKIKESLTSPVT